MIDFEKFEVCSFDCYGTLIDWERGIVSAVLPILSAHHVRIDRERLLELYARSESGIESGSYIKYRQVLRQVMVDLGRESGFQPTSTELECLEESIKTWPPFPDTTEALLALRRRYKLAVISNVDDDLFEGSACLLKVPFDFVITAHQCRAYKPSHVVFRKALSVIGVPAHKLLHVAQSVYHDIIPSRELGLTTVWVNRRHNLPGSGATPAAEGRPDLEVPDLKTLTSQMGL